MAVDSNSLELVVVNTDNTDLPDTDHVVDRKKYAAKN